MNKSKLFSIAWALLKSTKNNINTFSNALSLAWKKVKLKAKLKAGEVKFTFTKKDGTKRHATGTAITSQNYIYKKTSQQKFTSLVTYFDLDKNAIRSFHIWQLI